MIDEILAYNKQFVEKKGYEEYILSSTYKCNFLGADNKQ